MEQLSDGGGSLLWIGVGVLLGGVLLVILLRSRANIADRRPTTAVTPSATNLTLSARSLAEVRQLLGSGNKIQAIKMVRDQTGLGLKEAKEYVDALEGNPHADPTALAGPIALSSTTADAAADPEVRSLLVQGNNIQAIKRIRDLTGMGLREAKDLADTLERSPLRVAAAPPAGSPSDPTSDPEVRALVAQGKTIQAIKRIRELSGLGLKEAKDLVDRM